MLHSSGGLLAQAHALEYQKNLSDRIFAAVPQHQTIGGFPACRQTAGQGVEPRCSPALSSLLRRGCPAVAVAAVSPCQSVESVVPQLLLFAASGMSKRHRLKGLVSVRLSPSRP